MKKNKNKGFTLAELLIVVAIIGVLVAISIPIFTSQLEKTREATDAANIRSQYAEVMAEAITDGGNVNGQEKFGAVELKQKKDGWQSTGLKENLEGVYGTNIVGDGPKAGGTAWVEYNGEKAILHYEDGSGNSGSGSTGGGSTGSGSTGGGSTGGNTGGGSLGGGSGSLENPDEINQDTKLPNAFNSSINDWESVVKKDGYVKDSNYYYDIEPGMVYRYNGIIYLGTRKQQVDPTNQTPDKILDWYVIEKPTGKIWQQSDFRTQRNDVNRGDLCKVGNDYYVYNDGNTITSGPEKASRQWKKINLNK